MSTQTPYNTSEQANKTKVWFESMVQNLKLDQTLHEIDVLDKEKKDLYDAMISKDHEFTHSYARNISSTFFVTNMVEAYFKELSKASAKPIKLALELSNSKILVWAEIKEDDDKTEDALILSEAKINAFFTQYGFHISSTIVEDCDGLEIPIHYQKVNMD